MASFSLFFFNEDIFRPKQAIVNLPALSHLHGCWRLNFLLVDKIWPDFPLFIADIAQHPVYLCRLNKSPKHLTHD